jgi:hypothetical protein
MKIVQSQNQNVNHGSWIQIVCRAAILSLVLATGSSMCAEAAVVGTYLTKEFNSSDLTTYDFGDVSVPSDGLLVVVANGRASGFRTVSSISIGGTSATIHRQLDIAQAGPIAVASLEVTAGNRNITVAFSGGMARAAVGVWLLTGYSDVAPVHSDVKYNPGSGVSETVTLNFPETGGFAIYGVMANNGNSAFSWTNAASHFDGTIEGVATRVSYADHVASETGVVTTAEWTGSGAHSMIGAVWAPKPSSKLFRSLLESNYSQTKPFVPRLDPLCRAFLD